MKTIIPKLPKPFVVSEELQMKLEAWIEYFQNLSPRIRIKRPSDNDFNLKTFELMAKDLTEMSDDYKEIKLHGWPELEQVAFVVDYDSSLPGHPKKFSKKDRFIFCYGDVAFRLNYFERSDDQEEYNIFDFDLNGYVKESLEWNYVAKIIRESILEIQEEIKSSKPPPSDEKLFVDK